MRLFSSAQYLAPQTGYTNHGTVVTQGSCFTLHVPATRGQTFGTDATAETFDPMGEVSRAWYEGTALWGRGDGNPAILTEPINGPDSSLD